MAKYANNQPYYQAEENPVVTGIGRGLQSLAQGYAQRTTEDRERSRTQGVLEKYANAKQSGASSVELAGYLGQLDPKFAAQAIIEDQKQSATSQILASLGIGSPDQNAQTTRNTGLNTSPMEMINQLGDEQQPEAQQQRPRSIQDASPEEMDRAALAVGAIGNSPLASTLQQQANQKRKMTIHDQNITQKHHEESEKYVAELGKKEADAISSQVSSTRAREVLESGRFNNKSFRNIAKNYFKGTKWADYFNSPDRATLEAAQIQDLAAVKSIFTGVMSDKDVETALGKAIDPNKSVETNLSLIDFREFLNSMPLREAEIARQLIEENGGLRPLGLQDKVRTIMRKELAPQLNMKAAKIATDGQPMPRPTPQDPLMESVYKKVPEGHSRLMRGSTVITIPYALIPQALEEGFEPLEVEAT